MNIDGDIINGTFSTRAPKMNLKILRFILRDDSTRFIFNLGIFFCLVAALFLYLDWFWVSLVPLSFLALIAYAIFRLVTLRRIEFKNAVLAPGIVVSQSPLEIVTIANLATGEATNDCWAVASSKCSSLSPLSDHIGSRIPCVVAFTGSGFSQSWDSMVTSIMTDGVRDFTGLNDCLERLENLAEEEWNILDKLRKDGRLDSLAVGTNLVSELIKDQNNNSPPALATFISQTISEEEQ
jgi:hypothetical protein